MSSEELKNIDCWKCGAPCSLADIGDADGQCPRCDAEIDLAGYLQEAWKDYAALEAENARLVEDVKKWQALAQNVETLERVTESAEARRAQLAAIQGGMGEADPDGRHDKIKAMHDVMAAVPSSSLYSLAEALHDAGYGITAAMAAEVERLRVALGGMLFAFDDGVGQEWSKELLDFARKLTQAKEYKA